MTELQSIPEPDEAVLSVLSSRVPTNPFYTAEYCKFRKACGFQPWALLQNDHGVLRSGCTAFVQRGRLSRLLEIASLPRLDSQETFWHGLMSFCRSHRITDLCVDSFASEKARIPALAPESWRKDRREFVILLQHPGLWQSMNKGHNYCVKRGRKNGMQADWFSGESACLTHARLVDASMARRIERGEDVSGAAGHEKYLEILRSGAGALYQAILHGQVVSSGMVLKAPKGAYLHSMGSNAEGMQTGAAHFLLYELGNELKSQSAELLNLGGTEETHGGLVQFKSGFGASTVVYELESAQFILNPRWARYLKSKVVGIGNRFR
jgi:hypothetical protein